MHHYNEVTEVNVVLKIMPQQKDSVRQKVFLSISVLTSNSPSLNLQVRPIKQKTQ